MYFDQYYLDLLKEGKQIEEPYIFTVAKGKPKRIIQLTSLLTYFTGTPVPDQLLLVHEGGEWFSLQPSEKGMTLSSTYTPPPVFSPLP